MKISGNTKTSRCQYRHWEFISPREIAKVDYTRGRKKFRFLSDKSNDTINRPFPSCCEPHLI